MDPWDKDHRVHSEGFLRSCAVKLTCRNSRFLFLRLTGIRVGLVSIAVGVMG